MDLTIATTIYIIRYTKWLLEGRDEGSDEGSDKGRDYGRDESLETPLNKGFLLEKGRNCTIAVISLEREG